MDINIMELITPSLVIVVVALVAFGKIIKETSIKNNYIPLILGGIGMAASAIITIAEAGGASDAYGWMTLIANGVLRGIIAAAMAVYGNQLWKQGTELINNKEEK